MENTLKKFRIGVIGFAQMHITTLISSFQTMPDRFEFIGLCDLPTDLGPVSEQGGTRLGTRNNVLRLCPDAPVYEDYRDLIAAKPDLMLVTTENSRHAEVVCAALNEGIHVILEKPMAMSLAEARRMVAAARLHNALFMINWPTSWFTPFRTAHRLVQEGVVGRVLRFAYCNTSLGPFSYGQTLTDEEKTHEWWYHRALGGGSPMDYLGYGCILSRWFLGKKAIAAFAEARNFTSEYSDVDDHSTLILRFEDTQALIEGTWSTFSAGGLPNGPIIYGTEGTLVVDRMNNTISLYSERGTSKPTRVFEPDPLPEGREDLPGEFLHALETGEMHPTLSPELNLEATAAVDAALRSIASGKMEIVG